MLYRTLHNNSLMAFILVPFILLLFWVRVFLFEGVQPISFDGIHMPCGNGLYVRFSVKAYFGLPYSPIYLLY